MFLLSYFYGVFMNYYHSKSFTETATYAMTIIFFTMTIILYLIKQDVSEENMLEFKKVAPALILIFFAIWSMGAIAVTISTRIETLLNLLICTIVFMLGLVSDYLFSAHAHNSIIHSILYAVIPNWQLFWLADALASRRQIPIDYLLWSSLYVLIYISFCAYLSNLLFTNRELSAESV